MTRTRADIAAALNGVDGLTGVEVVPSTITAGLAWPVWVSTRFLNMRPDGPRETRWRAFAALPAGSSATSVDASDPLIEAVGNALSAIGLRIDLIEPVRSEATEGGAAIPLLRFTLTD